MSRLIMNSWRGQGMTRATETRAIELILNVLLKRTEQKRNPRELATLLTDTLIGADGAERASELGEAEACGVMGGWS